MDVTEALLNVYIKTEKLILQQIAEPRGLISTCEKGEGAFEVTRLAENC